MNCALNERSFFSRPQIRDLFQQFSLVKIYTDQIPPQYQPSLSPEENTKFQIDRFGDAQLPLYVIVEPTVNGDFKEVARYDEALISDEARFAEFLRKALPSNGAVAGR